MTIEIYFQYQIYSDSYDLVVMEERNGKRYIAKAVFEELEHGLIVDPTFRFTDRTVPGQFKKELQGMGLIDNADAATVKALNYHLEDMRSLVFKKK